MNYFLLSILTASFAFADSYNMQLLGYLSFDQMTSDITGFSQDGREFAVVGLQNTTSFVDVTNPSSPFETGRIDGGNSIWRDVKYWDRHVYIGTEADDGIKIVSVDDLDNPILVNTITDVDNSHNIHVDADGYFYIVGADEHDIWIYSLDNPSVPDLVGTWDTEYIHDLDVKDNIGYAMAIYSSTAYIIDLSDKSSPQTLVSWQYPGMAHDAAVTDDGEYLITADEMMGGNLKLWDIGDYSNINLLDEFTVDPQHSVHNVYYKDGLVYCSYYADGTRVYDVSSEIFTEVGYYDTSEIDGLYVGNWGTYVYLPSGNIISSDIETGLYILKYGGVTMTHTPIPDQSYSNQSFTFNVNAESYTGDITNVVLYYNVNNSSDWEYLEMQSDGESFTADVSFPDMSVVSYYFYAENSIDQFSFLPSMGESSPFIFILGEPTVAYSEDFESSTLFWSVTGNAVDGEWEVGEPVGTYYGDVAVQPEEDVTEMGDRCFVTGNGAPPNTPSNDDVDGGNTILTSPLIDLSNESQVLLTYWRWYTNNLGDNPSTDIWKVQVSDDAGESWVDIESTNLSDNSWQKKVFFLDQYVSLSEGIKIRFIAEDVFYDGEYGSGGSIVEAGVDEISIFSLDTVTDYPGDVNYDGAVDILDVVLTVNFAIGLSEPDSYELQASDINSDGQIDVLDVVILVNLILN